VQLFKKLIKVKSSCGESSQAHVFFGRESTLGIRVVLKQYNGTKKRAILKEVKVFTLLEVRRQKNINSDQLKCQI